MAKHEYYVVQGKTLDNVAETMKTVLGVDKDTPIRFDEITNNEKAEQVTESVDVQAEVIEQIKVALNGKSSIGVKEIMDIIDQSGVLESTEGTATEKVEQLVDRVENIYQLKAISCRGNQDINHFIYDCKGLNSLEYAFYNCNSLKTITLKNTEKVSNWCQTFSGSARIISIETLDFSSADKDYISGNVSGGWIWAVNLENIKIVPQTIKTSITFGTCSKLSAESIQSIIDGLATVETAQTLTLHKDAKILQSQVDSANAKGWTVAGGTVVSEEEYYG